MKLNGYILLYLFLIAVTVVLVESRRYHEIIWNSQHFDGMIRRTTLHVHFEDQLNIICPKAYNKGFQYEFSNLFWVSEKEWSQCWLQKPQLFGSCVNENRTTNIRMTFRRTNPIPGGKEFMVGKTYYIISTSSGEQLGIDQMSGGLCFEKQMKLAISVHEDRSRSDQEPAQKNGIEDLQYEIHEYQPYVRSSNAYCLNFTIHFLVASWTIFL